VYIVYKIWVTRVCERKQLRHCL